MDMTLSGQMVKAFEVFVCMVTIFIGCVSTDEEKNCNYKDDLLKKICSFNIPTYPAASDGAITFSKKFKNKFIIYHIDKQWPAEDVYNYYNEVMIKSGFIRNNPNDNRDIYNVWTKYTDLSQPDKPIFVSTAMGWKNFPDNIAVDVKFNYRLISGNESFLSLKDLEVTVIVSQYKRS